MTLERIPIEPSVLEWARSTAGLDVAQAAHRLSVSPHSLEKWEAGELQPTIGQLRKAAKTYRRPLAVLLLPRPPKDFQPISDFRSSRDGIHSEWTPELHVEMKRALSQREVFLEISEFSPAAIATSADLPAIGLGHSQEEAATLLRSWLELDSLPKGIWARPRELLNVVVASMERKGILVVQTQGVAIAEMRGFSIAEQPYPVIALNGKDWPRPRLFTLIHELAHLSANLGGVCDLHERSRPRASADDVEHACNRIAAAVLIPRDRILTVPLVASADAEWRWTLDDLETLSQPFGCSSEAMLLRLITLGKADWETYRLRKPELERQYDEARQRERERQREADGGPNYYLVKARNLGHGYVATVLDAYQAKAISSLDAAVYLDVRFDQIPKLQRVVGR